MIFEYYNSLYKEGYKYLTTNVDLVVGRAWDTISCLCLPGAHSAVSGTPIILLRHAHKIGFSRELSWLLKVTCDFSSSIFGCSSWDNLRESHFWCSAECPYAERWNLWTHRKLNFWNTLLSFENLSCCFLACEEKSTILGSKQSNDRVPISTPSPHAKE